MKDSGHLSLSSDVNLSIKLAWDFELRAVRDLQNQSSCLGKGQEELQFAALLGTVPVSTQRYCQARNSQVGLFGNLTTSLTAI